MLVLSRKEGESIWIGETEIVVRRIAGSKVRLSIAAERSIPIRRGELAPREDLPAEPAAEERRRAAG